LIGLNIGTVRNLDITGRQKSPDRRIRQKESRNKATVKFVIVFFVILGLLLFSEQGCGLRSLTALPILIGYVILCYVIISTEFTFTFDDIMRKINT